MIAVICAMSEERDALLNLMKETKVEYGKGLLYHDKPLDNSYYRGTIRDKEVVIAHSGVGKVYACINTTQIIEQYKPELIINLGCAGSLNEAVHVGDCVVADRVADWEIDVPGWKKSIDSIACSFPCSEKVADIVKNMETEQQVFVGNIVSSDQFIYKKSQVKTIWKFFPNALCGEMEGSSIANTCYAFGVKCAIIRSISDATFVQGDYKNFDFNLQQACDNAARLCYQIIEQY